MKTFIFLFLSAFCSSAYAQVIPGPSATSSVTQSTVPWVETGNFGGFTASVSTSPTVSTSAYSAGYTVGGLLTLSGLVRSANTTALLQKVVVSFADTQTPAIDVLLFNASPTSSTTTDHAAFALAAADIGKVVGVIHATDCSAAGTPTVCQAQQQAVPFTLPSAGGLLYAVAVTRSAITLGSTSDVTMLFSSLED